MADRLQRMAAWWWEVPRIVRLIVANAAGGAMLGALVGVAMLTLDLFHLRGLIMSGSEPWTAGILFFSGMMGTFASLYAGGAIMLDKGD